MKEPSMDYERQLVPGSLKPAMKEVGAGSRDLWQVPPERLRPIPGFNVRVRNADYEAHIRRLADSMKSEGFYQDKPLAGYVAHEGDEQVIYFYDGHSRHEAALLAISEGAEIPRLPVVVSRAGASLEDLTVALVQANNGKPLMAYEVAAVCKRLSRYGWTELEIAKRLGFTVTYVNDLLLLAAAPHEIREMVIQDRVAATLAIKALKDHGAKALEFLLAAERRAQASGKTKVTAKHAPGAGYQKAVRKSAPQLAAVITDIRHDPGYSALSDDLRQKLEDMIALLEKAKDEEDAGDESGTPAANPGDQAPQ